MLLEKLILYTCTSFIYKYNEIWCCFFYIISFCNNISCYFLFYNFICWFHRYQLFKPLKEEGLHTWSFRWRNYKIMFEKGGFWSHQNWCCKVCKTYQIRQAHTWKFSEGQHTNIWKPSMIYGRLTPIWFINFLLCDNVYYKPFSIM